MANKIKSEAIKTVWRFMYIYTPYEGNEKCVYTDDGDYVRILWRFYWRLSNGE